MARMVISFGLALTVSMMKSTALLRCTSVRVAKPSGEGFRSASVLGSGPLQAPR